MKTKNIFLTFAFVMFATFAFAQISASAHNLSGETWNTSGEICIVCHTPHNAMAITGAPLWNHEESAVNPYTVYSSGTLDATMGQPAGTSKLCLGCHDGTVGLESFGGVSGTANLISGDALVGGSGSLANHHPVSFVYNSTLTTADDGLHLTTAGGPVDDLLFGETADARTVECSSCHDPHNAGFDGLLVMSNAVSALCLVCHNK